MLLVNCNMAVGECSTLASFGVGFRRPLRIQIFEK